MNGRAQTVVVVNSSNIMSADGAGAAVVDMGLDELETGYGVNGIEHRTEHIPSPSGDVDVTVYASTSPNESTPLIVAYGDLGLHVGLSFAQFLSHPGVSSLIFPTFTVAAIDAPGLGGGAAAWEETHDGTAYPDFPAMVDQVAAVVGALAPAEFPRVLLMGLGSGGTVLTHYAVAHPDSVRGMVIIGATHKAPGWLEWGYSVVSRSWLAWWGMDDYVKDHLLQRYFSWREDEGQDNGFLKTTYNEALASIHPGNLWHFIAAYMARPALDDATVGALRTPALFLVGSDSYYYEDVVDFFGAFDSAYASWISVTGAGNMVHMEKPDQVIEPLRLFFYRCGFTGFALPR